MCSDEVSHSFVHQKVIFWAVYISLFECRDETEFIPLCGARGTWDGGPIHCRQGRQQKCRAMTSGTAQRTRPHSATTTHVHPCWTIFISTLNLLCDDAKKWYSISSIFEFIIYFSLLSSPTNAQHYAFFLVWLVSCTRCTVDTLTLVLLTWRIGWAHNNVRK